MNTIIVFLVEVTITFIASLLLVGYLRPHLLRVLLDLCGTDERVKFWAVFSNILLVGLPCIIALGFRPEATSLETLFFEVVGRLSGNLVGFMFALVMVGIAVSFFALVAPKPEKVESK